MKHKELVALDSRGRALTDDGYRLLTDRDQLDLAQEIKQLYFHAGRWSAGARDNLAREAYQTYVRRESDANRSRRTFVR